jgi:AcrR family transcriptional regulator
MKTRDKILNAAVELISSKGYQGATTREIARIAGVAEVTLFRHFASKERLFAETLQSFSSIPTLTKLVPELKKMSYEEGVRVLIVRFVTRLEELQGWLRVLTAEVAFSPNVLQNPYNDFMNQLFALLTDYFDFAHESGFLRAELEPLYVARSFHSMAFGFFCVEGFMGIRYDLVNTFAELIDTFVDIFCRGTKA